MFYMFVNLGSVPFSVRVCDESRTIWFFEDCRDTVRDPGVASCPRVGVGTRDQESRVRILVTSSQQVADKKENLMKSQKGDSAPDLCPTLQMCVQHRKFLGKTKKNEGKMFFHSCSFFFVSRWKVFCVVKEVHLKR